MSDFPTDDYWPAIGFEQNIVRLSVNHTLHTCGTCRAAVVMTWGNSVSLTEHLATHEADKQLRTELAELRREREEKRNQQAWVDQPPLQRGRLVMAAFTRDTPIYDQLRSEYGYLVVPAFTVTFDIDTSGFEDAVEQLFGLVTDRNGPMSMERA